ncbi:hypothetical protein GLOIN_2v1689810 [Rhizophagus clarus]|uniref:Uncharacterized protein n=1 Tax=Rhizophagus clarus TaxID=94130 RepID=A0A8H3QZQ7_9GLOM|nr:hypothetical protein GLOIN_2v1689810 [Rhizophagus clarus]
MGLQIAKCCFCIPLKAGVIIISLLWLLGGLSFAVLLVTNIRINRQEAQIAPEDYSDVVTFAISMVVIYAFISLGAAFGLYAVIFSKKYKMLKFYSTIGYIITGIQVLFSITSIIYLIIFKKICENYSKGSSTCNQLYFFNLLLSLSVIYGICMILLSVYFSLVISAYARRRKSIEEEAATYLNGSSSQTNHNLVVDLSDQTNHNLVVDLSDQINHNLAVDLSGQTLSSQTNHNLVQ